MDIFFQIDEPFVANIPSEPIKQALQTTIRLFSKTKTTTGSVGIKITDNKTVQQLNHRYRGIDAPTDVLSFENRPDPDFPDVGPEASHHLGDIIIAYPIAATQAASSGHTPLEEIILLAVHGTLHLLGFDHDTSSNKEKMWAAQHQIMTHLGLAHVQPIESEILESQS